MMSFLNVESPVSSIERQDITLDDSTVVTVQWLDDARLRVTVWANIGGMKRRKSGITLSAADAAAFLSTLTTSHPA
jgi:hypothetical protein